MVQILFHFVNPAPLRLHVLEIRTKDPWSFGSCAVCQTRYNPPHKDLFQASNMVVVGGKCIQDAGSSIDVICLVEFLQLGILKFPSAISSSADRIDCEVMILAAVAVLSDALPKV